MRFKRLPQWNHPKLSISSFLTNPCPCNLSGSKVLFLYGRRFWGLSIFLSGYMSTSRLLHSKYITSFPIGPPWIWPFAVLSTSTGSDETFETQTSSSEDEVADQFLNQILSAIKNKSSSTSEICSTYIKKLCKAKNLSAAARLLKSLREKDVFFNLQPYNLLLAAASEENNINLATKIFKDTLFFHLPPNSVSYLNVARTFKKNDDPVLLLNFVRDVAEITSSGSPVVVNRIIYAFADCGQVDNAVLIFYHLRNLNCKPDLITYNTILGILGRTARIDEMLHEFASMKDINMIPDIISYNTILNSLGRVGRSDLCLQFLKEMDEKGLKPDLRTYTMLIESFGRSGNVEASLKIFNMMKDKKIRLSIYIYRSLISNLKRMGKSELAVAMSQEMNASLSDLIGPNDFKRKNK